MATITERKRTNGKPSFTAQVRIKEGGKVVFQASQTFPQRRLAKTWAATTEKAWREGKAPGGRDRTRFCDVLRRYRDDISEEAGKTVLQCLRTLAAMPETDIPVSDVNPGYLVDLGRCLKSAGRAPATVNNYMQHLYPLFDVAEAGFGVPLKYDDMVTAMRTMRRLKIIGKAAKRTRRPSLEELNKLIEAAHQRSLRSNASPLHKIIAFAVTSSRRLSEITRLRWSDFNPETGMILVRDMKHPGQKRGNDVWVLLPEDAQKIAFSMPQIDERIFPFNPESLSTAFTDLVKLFDEIDDLHFHDLRHEAISRRFEMGWSPAQVRMMSGHQAWSSLEIYTNLEKVGDKLQDWVWWEEVCKPERAARVAAMQRKPLTKRGRKTKKNRSRA
ncbi:tyrosine-type recombinase/integrase [Pseudaestuariivita rosea]|uniref:tyrosine-type recombinase/integrase n=1 Tax=Pseudaestuariivita rosea TaxID=2763263 RepID=UPI001ABB8716|nr:tyrosine-type recombinase/integrase [Pseudaestuariivita rosea]